MIPKYVNFMSKNRSDQPEELAYLALNSKMADSIFRKSWIDEVNSMNAIQRIPLRSKLYKFKILQMP